MDFTYPHSHLGPVCCDSSQKKKRRDRFVYRLRIEGMCSAHEVIPLKYRQITNNGHASTLVASEGKFCPLKVGTYDF